MGELRTTCPECHTEFSVPSSMRGGYANCPECGRASQVGGADLEFGFLLGAAFVVLLIVTGFVYTGAGLIPAAVTLGVGIAIMGLVSLCL